MGENTLNDSGLTVEQFEKTARLPLRYDEEAKAYLVQLNATFENGLPVQMKIGERTVRLEAETTQVNLDETWIPRNRISGLGGIDVKDGYARSLFFAIRERLAENTYFLNVERAAIESIENTDDKAKSRNYVGEYEKYRLSAAFFSFIYSRLGPQKLMEFYGETTKRYSSSSIPIEESKEAKKLKKGIWKGAWDLASSDVTDYFKNLIAKKIPARSFFIHLPEDDLTVYVLRLGDVQTDEKTKWLTALQAVKSTISLIKMFGIQRQVNELVVFEMYDLEKMMEVRGGYNKMFDTLGNRFACGGFVFWHGMTVFPFCTPVRDNSGDHLVINTHKLVHTVWEENTHWLDPNFKNAPAQLSEGFAQLGAEADGMGENTADFFYYLRKSGYGREINLELMNAVLVRNQFNIRDALIDTNPDLKEGEVDQLLQEFFAIGNFELLSGSNTP